MPRFLSFTRHLQIRPFLSCSSVNLIVKHRTKSMKTAYLNPETARKHIEAVRWPDGAFCPHCGSFRVRRLGGSASREGAHQCNDCRGQFTVTVGTVLEHCRLPLNKALYAVHLLTASKKGISSLQLSRMLLVTYKTAWFLSHRIRKAMEALSGLMGIGGGAVEADEMFVGRDFAEPLGKGGNHKQKAITIIDRDTGRAQSTVLDFINVKRIREVVTGTVSPEARLMTDKAQHFLKLGEEFAEHGAVNHTQKEYVSAKDASIHVNTVEGFFSVFKRGMNGIYQHCAKRHLHRYLAEFDFRYSNRSALGIEDAERCKRAVQGLFGKRLTYREVVTKAA